MLTVAMGENTKARFADLFGRQANRAVVSRSKTDCGS
jgi:hypothetical protein